MTDNERTERVKVEVTQADKSRADRWLDRPSNTPARRSERDRLANQFARHRIAALRPTDSGLVWSKNRAPSDECRYDNCRAVLPFGEIRIEWKSWKDYPAYTVAFEGQYQFVGSYGSLDGAKAAAESFVTALRAQVQDERAEIVAWLRTDEGKGGEDGADWALTFADAIEAGQHKGTGRG